MIDFGLAAKVRPALLSTSEPADDELDLVTAILHTTAVRGNRWELNVPKPFLKQAGPWWFTRLKAKALTTEMETPTQSSLV